MKKALNKFMLAFVFPARVGTSSRINVRVSHGAHPFDFAQGKL
jgi:hypothetical protein